MRRRIDRPTRRLCRSGVPPILSPFHGRRIGRGFPVGAVAVLLIAALLRGEAAAQHPSDDATAHRSFDDVLYWEKVFDDPKRDEWQRPDELVVALALEPGMRVADLGAGTGYLTRRLSRAVGASGSVLAAEVEPKLVAHLRERAEREGLANVTPVLASTDNPRLPAGVVDLVLILDTYHHIDDRVAYLRRLRPVLTARGRIAIIDWHKRPLPEGPPPPHKLARRQVIDEMKRAGYDLRSEEKILPFQYFLVFSPRE